MNSKLFPTLASCCIVFPLRIGGFIIGALEIIGAIFSIFMSILLLIMLLVILSYRAEHIHILVLVFSVICVGFHLSFLIGTGIMIAGIKKRRPNYIYQWIVQEFISMGILVLYLVVLISIEILPTEFEYIIYYFIIIVYLVIKWYSVSVVYSYYDFLRNPNVDDIFGIEHTSWRQLRDQKCISEEQTEEKTQNASVTHDAESDVPLTQ